MRTDLRRKTESQRLRKTGMSIKAIAREMSAAQSSVSIWTRDIALTSQQRETLRANTHSIETVEKRRQSRLKNEAVKRQKVIDIANLEVETISRRELWLIGVALYWAEGAKKRGMVQFTNGDPRMIRLMMKFYREICKADEHKLRGYIHIHEHLDVPLAEAYWRDITGLPSTQFYKTYNKPNISSKGLRSSLPYGVCDVYVMDTNLFLRIQGWTEGIYQSVIK